VSRSTKKSSTLATSTRGPLSDRTHAQNGSDPNETQANILPPALPIEIDDVEMGSVMEEVLT
jgi:hypothetical protein